MAKHKSGHAKISRKISHLIRKEGKSQNQAVGQAFGMARSGSLGRSAKKAAGKEFANPNAQHLWPESGLHGGNPRKY